MHLSSHMYVQQASEVAFAENVCLRHTREVFITTLFYRECLYRKCTTESAKNMHVGACSEDSVWIEANVLRGVAAATQVPVCCNVAGFYPHVMSPHRNPLTP